MPETTTRRSLLLTAAQWTALEAIAADNAAMSQRGPTAGQPSWRVLVAMIADGKLVVIGGSEKEASDDVPADEE